MAALAAVIGAILLLARLARARLRPAQGRAGRRITVQETVPLDSRRRLSIVRCDGRDCLILTGGPADLVVGWIGPNA